MLDKQRKSRERLARAVQDYVKLRVADGQYDAVVPAEDRLGRRVNVFVHLDILPDEG